jgi:hypothetical protein
VRIFDAVEFYRVGECNVRRRASTVICCGAIGGGVKSVRVGTTAFAIVANVRFVRGRSKPRPYGLRFEMVETAGSTEVNNPNRMFEYVADCA